MTQAAGLPNSWTWSGPRSRADRNQLVVGWLTSIVFPPIGLILGMVMSGTDRRHGIVIVVVSSLVLLLGITDVVADASRG